MKYNESKNLNYARRLQTPMVGLLTLLLVFCLHSTIGAQDNQSNQKGVDAASQESKDAAANKKAKPKIKKYPDAKVWSDAAVAAKEFPGFQFIGEFAKGKQALQVTPSEGKFYLSTFQGGLPGAGWDKTPVTHQWVELADLKTRLEGWKRVDRSTDVVGKKPPEGAVVLFDGSDASAWNNAKITKDGNLKAGTRTQQTFQDFRLYFEFLVPLKPEPPISHPHRGNSGVFALGAYEVQVADTFGLDLDPQAWQDITILKPTDTWCGGVYGIQAPSVNMCLPPLTWQSMEIEFMAARFEGKKKVSSAVISVIHNGVKVHDNLTLTGGTGGGPSGPRAEVPEGPISLQNHGNPNLFRNIWIVPNPPQAK